MAKKRYAIQNKIPVAAAAPTTSGVLRVDRCLSRMNHRLYREGRFYEVKIDLDVSNAPTGPVEVFALKDTWANHQAYKMAFDVYMKSTAEERSRLSKSQLARWQDFRVSSGVSMNALLPRVADGTGAESQLTNGENLLSLVTDSSGNDRTFTWGTAAASEYNIVDEYQKKANISDEPDSATAQAPYSDQASDTSDNESLALQNRGNSPPYDADSFGQNFVKVATLSASPGQQKLSSGFFSAPCGIVFVTGMEAAVLNPLTLTVKLGDYKGVHAPSMLDV